MRMAMLKTRFCVKWLLSYGGIMQKRLKQMIYGTMLIVVLMGLIRGFWFRSILALCLLAVGSYLIDIRQVKRYTELILNKYFVCTDFEAYQNLVNELEDSLFYPHLRAQTLVFFELIKGLIPRQDQFVKTLGLKLDRWYTPDLWRAYSQFVLDERLSLEHIQAIESQYQHTYLSRFIIVSQIMDKPDAERLALLMEARAEADNNLQFAWLNWLISASEQDPARRSYYQRIAANIAPDLFPLISD